MAKFKNQDLTRIIHFLTGDESYIVFSSNLIEYPIIDFSFHRFDVIGSSNNFLSVLFWGLRKRSLFYFFKKLKRGDPPALKMRVLRMTTLTLIITVHSLLITAFPG